MKISSFISFVLFCVLLPQLCFAQPVITIDTIIDATCNASADGAIQISVSGNPNFTYNWSNGATTEDISGVFANSYVVTVTDGFGLSTVSGVLTINAPAVLNVNTDSIIPISCAGDTNGAVYISVLGGVAPYTYSWYNGTTTQDVTGLGAGPVGLTVTDANGCTSSPKSIAIDSINAIAVVVDAVSNLSCNAANDGFINITASGGVGGFAYLWSSGQTTADISGLAAAAYIVTVTDSNSCQQIVGPITISQPAVLGINLDSIQQNICNGNNSAAIFMTTVGGTSPFSYLWTNAATTEDISGLIADTYFVTVTDSNGCQASSGPHVVSEPPALVVVVDTIINQLCAGQPTASIDLNVGGGTPNYTYFWSNGSTTQDISGLYSGVNDVTVTDANGCTASAKSIFVDSINPLSLVVDSTFDVSCNGANDGAIFVTSAGGVGNYTFNWSNGATTEDISGLAGNSYTLTVTDSNSCFIQSIAIVVNEPAALIVNLDSVNTIDCNGDADGAIYVSVVGGTTSYTYNWSNAATTQDISGLNGGSFYLTVTDANGCQDSIGPIQVFESSVLLLQLDSIQSVDCNGNANGSIAVLVSGGSPSYVFNWSNGSTAQDISGLNGGLYSLTVTDSLGCQDTDTAYVVNEPAAINLTLDSLSDVSCFGFANGFIFISDSGGTSPLSYLWSNGATTQDIAGIGGGNYQLTVSDNNGCIDSLGPFNINEPAGMSVNLDTIIHVSCNAAADGSINITVNGGGGNYSYLWSTASTTEDLSNLSGGAYLLTVTDLNNCTVSAGPYVVQEDSAILIVLDSVLNSSCNGFSDGQLWTSVSGGVGPYSYNWSNAASVQDITGLAAGTYTLTVTDSVGCTAQDSTFTIIEPAILQVQVDSQTNVACQGGSDATVSVSANGGTAPYIYLWSNAATGNTLTGLSAGIYTLSLTDSNACFITSVLTITEPSSLSVTASANPISCSNSTDGIARVFVSGGSPAYTFAWDASSGAQTTDFAVGLAPGSYCVTVTDQNNCSDSICVTVSSTSHTFEAFGDTTICEGDTIPLSALPGFSYAWTPALSLNDSTIQNPTAFPIISTNYIVQADTLSGVNIIYNGDFEDGSAGFSSDYVVGSGGTFGQLSNPGTYAINSNAAFTHNNFAACTDHTTGTGNFMIVNGATTAGQNVWCQTVSVTPNTNYQLSTWINSVVTDNPAILQFSVNGIALGNSFNAPSSTCVWNQFFELWNSGTDTTATICIINQNTQQGGNDFGLDDIEFMAICQLSDSVQVNVNPKPNIQTSTTAPVCAGDSFNVVATGGQTYNWSGPSGFSSSNDSLLFINSTSADSGQFQLVVETADGCIDSTNLTIDVFPNPSLSISGQDVSCFGLTDAQATANPLGGTSPYTYLWSDGQTTSTAQGLSATSYQLTLTDANNCSDTASVILNEPVAISTSTTSTNVLCYGQSTGTAAVSVTNAGAFSYLWSSSGQTTSTASGLAAGIYQVTSTDSSGCFVVDSVTITQADSFQNISTTSTQVDCIVDSTGSLTINVSGATPGYNYTWSDGQSTASAVALAAGSYIVTVTDANACTLIVTDTVYPSFQPQVQPFAGQPTIVDTTLNWGDVLLIDVGNDQSADSVIYFWEEMQQAFGLNLDDETAVQTTVMPQPDSNTVYTILLTATSADGCTDTASLTIRVNIDVLLGMPDAFSPNGDGFNDYFRPAGLDDQFILEFKIFNRWGQVVFDGTDTSVNWDGTYLGVEQPSEVYIYLLQYQLPGQAAQTLKGEMTLIR